MFKYSLVCDTCAKQAEDEDTGNWLALEAGDNYGERNFCSLQCLSAFCQKEILKQGSWKIVVQSVPA